MRAAFRDAVFAQSGYRCVVCGVAAPTRDPESVLDAHHITNRNEFPNGGYVRENGAALCKVGKDCHRRAEAWLQDGKGEAGYDPDTLYRKVGSSREKAAAADARLG